MTASQLASDDLEALFDAFNRHDVDAVMGYFADDAVFNAVGGSEACGTRIVGRNAIADAFSGVWRDMPDAHWNHHGHFVHGDKAVSEWTFTGTNGSGARIEAEGCDIFTLRDGRIVRKQAFRKNRPTLEP